MSPITAADLPALGAANHAEDDSSTQGGAVAPATKVAMVPMAAADTLEMVSSSASDTAVQVRVTMRNAGGDIVQDTKTTNGTTPVAFTGTANRVLKVDIISGTAVGTITVRRASAGPTVCTLEPAITQVRTLFYDAASGPSQKILYEKFFVRNNHGTLSLTSAALSLAVEPANISNLRFALEDAIDDTNSSANRLTEPTGIGSWNELSASASVPGGSIPAGSEIGVWFELTLAADNVAVLDDWQVQATGAAI